MRADSSQASGLHGFKAIGREQSGNFMEHIAEWYTRK
jgi:hypothetical protein